MKQFITILSLLILALLLSCSRDDTASSKIASDKKTGPLSVVDVIRLEGGDWGYPSPFAHYPRGPGGFKMGLIFDSLLERDEKGLIPWLAEKYEITENGKVYVFTIRQNVLWQDGSPLTPEDVCFSIEYAAIHPTTWSHVFNRIEHVEIGENNTVKVFLKAPSAPMLYNLGLTRIIPRHIWKNVTRPKEFTAPEAVIGSGPYVLKNYSKEHGTYRFEASGNFWGPKQKVKTIEFIPVSEPVLAYENNEIDLVTITPDLLLRFEKNPSNKIVKGPAFWGYRLLFNMESQPVLRDKRVRQAFAQAVDLNELVEKIARGAALPGSPGILPPDHVMASSHIKACLPDKGKAAMLLAQAGFDRVNEAGVRMNADHAALEFELLCSSQEVRMAEILKQRLGTVGIRIRIKSADVKTCDFRVRNHDYALAIIGHGGWGGDPEYLAQHLLGEKSTLTSSSPLASGLTGLDVPELTDLLARQQTETDPVKRRGLIQRIQEIAADEVPEIPLYYTVGYNVYRPAAYDGWMFMFDHHSLSHAKLSFLERQGQ